MRWLVSKRPVDRQQCYRTRTQKSVSDLDKVGVQLDSFRGICDAIAVGLELDLRLSTIAVKHRVCVVLLDRLRVEVDCARPVVLLEGLVAFVLQGCCGGTVFVRSHDVDELYRRPEVVWMVRGKKVLWNNVLSRYHILYVQSTTGLEGLVPSHSFRRSFWVFSQTPRRAPH